MSDHSIESKQKINRLLPSKLITAMIATLCLWITFGLSSEEKVVLPKNVQLKLYSAWGTPKTNAKKQSDYSTIDIDGFSFSKQAIKLSHEEQERLISMLESKGLYEEAIWKRYLTNKPIKRCDGFHADYALVWKEYRLFICFGCGEVKYYKGDKIEEYDLKYN